MSKRIIVASHRRSGTHLTINAVVNNFQAFHKNPDISLVTLDYLSSHVNKWNLTYQELESRIDGIPCVLKTHSHANIENFFIGNNELQEFIKELFNKVKIIYVHRDGRDVMTSLYHYQKSFNAAIQEVRFSEYIRMPNNFDKETYSGDLDRIEYWRYHVNSWKDKKNCLLLSFHDFKKNYLDTLKKISEFIEEPLKENLRDVRRKAQGKTRTFFEKFKTKLLYNDRISKYSSVMFRKGSSGDWREFFSSEDLKFFNHKAGELNRSLGYH